ncbi:MAG: crotonase [Gammaproteobacteria bacterium]|nr:crotonase [Gammaproteobacteria bacterium]
MKIEFQNWTKEIDDFGIAWLGLDCIHSSANTISSEVLDELNILLQKIANNTEIKGVVFHSLKSSGFIAGANIHVFSSFKEPEQVKDFLRKGLMVFNKIEQLTVPTIAMIDGFCFGGGLELALACRYRLASERQETKLALPEVMLGFNPGWGGTVRLPKLIGGFDALAQLMLSGKAVSAKAAKKMGLVDEVLPVRQLKRAAYFYVAKQPKPYQPNFMQSLSNLAFVRPFIAKILRQQVAKKVSLEHYPAPNAMIYLWEKYYAMGTKAYEMETESALKLVFGHPSSQNLIRAFLLKDRLKEFGKQSQFKAAHVHVIGAGVMGGDIAAWCALKGLKVTLEDQSFEKIAPAYARAKKLYEKRLKSPRLVQAALDRFILDPHGYGIRHADVIIEAVFENLEVKQEIFKKLEKMARKDAILATNTSSIPLEEIATIMKQPERLLGIHFFNPVAMMELVEVVGAKQTDVQALKNASAFVLQIARIPLPVKSSPGFLVNRVLMPYLMESMELLQEGIAPEAIDKAAKDFGMMMGPVELADTVGLDVCLAVAKNQIQYFGGQIPKQLLEKVEKGEIGRKAGKGFYQYKQGKPIKKQLTKAHVSLDISQRLIMRMVNEAAACIREGVVADAELLDAGMLYGTGFAPFRGGPMNYAKQYGQAQLNDLFCQLQNQYGERFKAQIETIS